LDASCAPGVPCKTAEAWQDRAHARRGASSARTPVKDFFSAMAGLLIVAQPASDRVIVNDARVVLERPVARYVAAIEGERGYE
jgi:hypothetical protein